MSHPFKFGVMTNGGQNVADAIALAKRVESLGYEGIYYNDHYAGPGPAMTSANHAPQQLAAIPLAAAVAMATDDLIIGFRVLCIDYHNPVVLAKELATLGEISGGRVDVGLGAGWITAEYEAMNVPLDPPGKRIERLGDVVTLMRQCFAGVPVNVDGKTGVAAHGFTAVPPLLRQPPITIGGGGPKVLQLAARVADIIAFNVDNRSGKLAPENVERTKAGPTLEKVALIRAAAGDRFDSIELEIGAHFVFVTDDVDSVTSGLAAMTHGMFAMSKEDTLAHPHAIIGDVEDIIDTIVQRRETFGFSRVTVLEHNVDAFAPVVERLAGT